MISLAKCSRLLALAVVTFMLLTAPARATEEKEAGRVPMPNEVKGKGTQCVQPTEVMRRNHMQFILHQRDKTVHQGIRTKQYSLKECINCHVQPKADGSYPSIHTKEHFCNSCHTYAAVHIDCFECHATHPVGNASDVDAKTESSLQSIDKAPAAGGTAQ